MELFSFHCTTCKARLVVKDASVIGDILSCPKCGSMVQVVPPVGWKRPGSGDSSPGELAAVAPAASQPSAPARDKDKSASRPATKEPPLKKVAAAAAVIPPALPPRPAPQPATAVNPSATAASDPALPTTGEAAAMPAVPETAPSLYSAAVAWAKRDWLLLSSGLAGGVVLGAAVWLVVAMQSTVPVVVADRAPSDAPSTEVANTEQASPPTAVGPASKSPQPSNAGEPADVPREQPQVVADANPPPEPTDVKSATAAAPEGAEPPAAPPAPGETTEDAALEEPGPALKLEPIRPSGTPLDLSATLPSAASAPPQELVPLEAEPADEAAESPGNPGPLSREQIDERLAVSLASVEFADVPLAQFTTFIADVSGVPVTLDEAALAKAGQGRKSPISVKLTQTTAGEALRAAIEHAGLSIAVQDGRIVVTRASE